jgi:hypothetical protein
MKIFRVLAVIMILATSLIPIVISADSSVTVIITADPSVTAGITSFTITYINESEIDLDWTVDPTVDKVMVRAKWGEYPDDIPNENVAPSDGYLVYYGFDFSTIDTSMDFESNLGTLYYKAWAQKPTGKWYVDTFTGFKESEVVTLILLFGTGLVISGFAIMKRHTVVGILASALWLACIAYTRTNPIGEMVTGDTSDTAILLALIGLMVLVPIISFQLSRKEERETVGNQGLLKDDGEPSLREVSSTKTRKENADDYYARLHRVTHPKRTR